MATMRALLSTFTVTLLLGALAGIARPWSPSGFEDVEALAEELRQKRDSADVDLIQELGNKRTREAMVALLEVYDVMDSVYMRRAVLRGLAKMDGVESAQQPALQKIMDVATEEQDRDLRLSAVDALAGCHNLGRTFLAMIVEAPAEDDVRERAMEYHTGSPKKADLDWYRNFFDPLGIKRKADALKGREREDEEPEEGAEPAKKPYPLPEIRFMAFKALQQDLSEEEVRAALRDRRDDIRVGAIHELNSRGVEDIDDIAEDFLGRFGQPKDRIAGAQILGELHGAARAKEFIKLAGRVDTELNLRIALAEVLRKLDDERTDRDLIKLVGKGKAHDKLFALYATRDLEDDKLDKKLISGLKDKDRDVRMLTLEVMEERKREIFLKDLDKFVGKTDDPVERAAAMDAISAIRGDDPEWIAELQGIVNDPDSETEARNSAIRQLSATGQTDLVKFLTVMLSHEDWSTRLAALHALEKLAIPEVVPIMIARLPEEEGRMAVEFGESLFNLTAQSFGSNQFQWEGWWKDNAEGFEIASAGELKKKTRELEDRELKEISKSTFFGIRIDSHRVTFIVDVSGSMEERTRGRYTSDKGEKRIAVAKRELARCLDGLDKRSLFNIITFSDKPRPWKQTIQEYNVENLEAATEYVEGFIAGGGTNLYDSIRLAFNDPDVDSIYILSDGEPTVGAVTEPGRILRHVSDWNRSRGVKIHCIAIGGSLAVLEQLASTTGGDYVRFP